MKTKAEVLAHMDGVFAGLDAANAARMRDNGLDPDLIESLGDENRSIYAAHRVVVEGMLDRAMRGDFSGWRTQRIGGRPLLNLVPDNDLADAMPMGVA